MMPTEAQVRKIIKEKTKILNMLTNLINNLISKLSYHNKFIWLKMAIKQRKGPLG